MRELQCCLPACCRVPLIVHALLDVPASDKAAHTESAHVSNDTRILLLAALPYVAGVAMHVVNALHSHRVNERRWAVDGLQVSRPAQLKSHAAVLCLPSCLGYIQ